MAIGDAGGFDTARVADDDFRPVFASFNHPAGDDRVGVGAVIAKDQQAFRVFDIANRVAHRAVTERQLKPGYRRAVADAGAAVDVVGVEHAAGEFLYHIVGFIPGTAR